MTKDEHKAFLATVKEGDPVCSTFIYTERFIVRRVVSKKTAKNETGFVFWLDGGTCCSNCKRSGTPINGYNSRGIDGKYVFPII